VITYNDLWALPPRDGQYSNPRAMATPLQKPLGAPSPLLRGLAMLIGLLGPYMQSYLRRDGGDALEIYNFLFQRLCLEDPLLASLPTSMASERVLQSVEDLNLPEFLDNVPEVYWNRANVCQEVLDMLAERGSDSAAKTRTYRARMLRVLKSPRFSDIREFCHMEKAATVIHDQLSRLMPVIVPTSFSVKALELNSENTLVLLDKFLVRMRGVRSQLPLSLALCDAVTELLTEHDLCCTLLKDYPSQGASSAFGGPSQSELMIELTSQAYRDLERELDQIRVISQGPMAGVLAQPLQTESDSVYFRVFARVMRHPVSSPVAAKFMLHHIERLQLRSQFLWLDTVRSQFVDWATLKIAWDGVSPITPLLLAFKLDPLVVEALRTGRFAKIDVLKQIFTPLRTCVLLARDGLVFEDNMIFDDAFLRSQHKLFADRMYAVIGYASAARVVVLDSYAAVVDTFTQFVEMGHVLGGDRRVAHKAYALEFLHGAVAEASEVFVRWTASKQPGFPCPVTFLPRDSKSKQMLMLRMGELRAMMEILSYAPELLGPQVTFAALCRAHSLE
jgi:hypothetical protein